MNENFEDFIFPAEAEKAFLVDRDGLFETKSKDKLEIRFDRKASDEHFSTAWLPTVAVYQVDNLTKKEKMLPSETYTVAFFRSESGEVIIATCNCPARLRCKHIVRAWIKHADAEKTGFVPQI